jgi:3-oxoacyl-[acyl-carrier protein] reductase
MNFNEDKISERTQSLLGKTAMVTGSSSGIGRAIALEFANRGADIIIHGRTLSDELKSLKLEIESLGRRSFSVLADFAAGSSLDEFANKAWSCQNRIDCWINNAGGDVLTGDWPHRSLDEKLDFLFKVDVRATLFLSRVIGQKMSELHQSVADSKPGQFSILNMGWDQAWQGMAGDSGELFATTKGAIMSMTKSLAQSFAPAVRVNCLAPGWIQTKWGETAPTDWSQRARQESLMDRWGQPEDIAHAAAFLASDDASFIAGQIVPVNGGFNFFNAS